MIRLRWLQFKVWRPSNLKQLKALEELTRSPRGLPSPRRDAGAGVSSWSPAPARSPRSAPSRRTAAAGHLHGPASCRGDEQAGGPATYRVPAAVPPPQERDGVGATVPRCIACHQPLATHRCHLPGRVTPGEEIAVRGPL